MIKGTRRLYGTPVDINVEKVYYKKNTFTVLKFSNFTIYYQKIFCKKNLGKVKIIKVLARFDFMTYKFLENPLARFTSL